MAKPYPTCQVRNTFQGSNIHCMISGICSAFIEHPTTPVPGPTQSRSLFPGIQITAEQQNINITHCAPLGSPAFRAWPITTSRTKKNHWVIYTKKRGKKRKEKRKGKNSRRIAYPWDAPNIIYYIAPQSLISIFLFFPLLSIPKSLSQLLARAPSLCVLS